MKKGIRRSPLFYVGDKYKLVGEIKTKFPTSITRFIEPFVGGGSVFMNIEAKEYLLNDIDKNVVHLHRFLCSHATDEQSFFNNIFDIIGRYELSCSYKGDVIPHELKKQFVKTYYAHYNKENFIRMREDYNRSDRSDDALLYVLLIYGFNRMLRFNNKGEYNLPVGNVDFNRNTVEALKDYFRIVSGRNISWSSMDYKMFLRECKINADDFVYLDPPYLITFSEYNKLWNDKNEAELLAILDELNGCGVRFAISNVTHYKGKENAMFTKWAKRYTTYQIKSNYISYHDNTIKKFNEVLVTNYQ